MDSYDTNSGYSLYIFYCNGDKAVQLESVEDLCVQFNVHFKRFPSVALLFCDSLPERTPEVPDDGTHFQQRHKELFFIL